MNKFVESILFNLQKTVETHWYQKQNIYLLILLLPCSWLFYIISKLRYYGYRFDILKQYRLPIPLIVVGNISVGGVGKTPFVIYLVQQLQNMNIHVGVVLRGYKGSQNNDACVINNTHNSAQVGDEAMLYLWHDIPVAIGKNRYDAGLALIKQYPHLQLIISDDGLQHYRLYHDYEIVIIDESRMFGNGYLLPCGPLRETTSRLKSVNCIIINQKISNYNNIEQHTNELDIKFQGISNKTMIIYEQLVLQDIYKIFIIWKRIVVF